MISRIEFKNFRSFKDYQVALKEFNVLVGPNNSGKSTILDSLRMLSGVLRSVTRRNPTRMTDHEGRVIEGWSIPATALPESAENIHNELSDEPTVITYHHGRGKSLVMTFPPEGQPKLHMQMDGRIPRTTKLFKREFPISISVIPTLGPFETDEKLLQESTAKANARTHRAARSFRNLWFHERDDFDKFASLLESTWPNCTISLPEVNYEGDARLTMFMQERRMPREIAWAGFGFQVWLQLLTHIVRANESSTIIVDEPEIYLHPDLQHKIVDILRQSGPQVITATHSVEIINEVDPSEVLLIERPKKAATRLSNLPGLDRAVSLLGSSQNMHLTRLSRGKRILFVEGEDKKILSRLAIKLGHSDLFDTSTLTVIPLNGFSGYGKIENAQWAFEKVLGEGMKVGAIFDRDYRCDEEIESITSKLREHTSFIHILKMKEIENYLLDPSAIQHCIEQRLHDQIDRGGLAEMPSFSAEELLLEVSERFKNLVLSRIASQRAIYFERSPDDISTHIENAANDFDSKWSNWKQRQRIIPGKAVLSELNVRISELWGISVSSAFIASSMKQVNVDPEIPSAFAQIHSSLIA